MVTPLNLVKLAALMERTSGSTEVVVGLLDGPVVPDHLDLEKANIRTMPNNQPSISGQTNSDASVHGTFVAGILAAKRGSAAPAICPNCTLLVRPIFHDKTPTSYRSPNASPTELAAAIVECIEAGARVLNLSLGLTQLFPAAERDLAEALDYAASRGVIVVAAAGNQGAVGSSALTRHPWVIPVVAYNLQGKPTSLSNLGHSIGRRGLGAPGDGVASLGVDGKPIVLGGTSVAAPFVTGTIALLWAEFPNTTAGEMKLAVTQAAAPRRTTVVPPLLNAWAAYQALARSRPASISSPLAALKSAFSNPSRNQP